MRGSVRGRPRVDITLSVDEEVVEKVRRIAVNRDTTLSAMESGC